MRQGFRAERGELSAVCRHLAYLGVATSPHELLLRAPHSLCHQSYAPRDMRGGGTVNVDGFGLGWFPDGQHPATYRRASPIWTDQTLPALAETIWTPAFVAAVRAATPGMPVTESACAPMSADGWLFSHNGVITGWPDSVSGLAERLPVSELLRLEAPTDSALLWALLCRRLRTGTPPLTAVRDLVDEVARAAPGSRLNLVVTNGRTLVATAWEHALWLYSGQESVVVASEPCDDDPAWRPVPDGHAVLACREQDHWAQVVRIDKHRG